MNLENAVRIPFVIFFSLHPFHFPFVHGLTNYFNEEKEKNTPIIIGERLADGKKYLWFGNDSKQLTGRFVFMHKINVILIEKY